MNTIRTYSETPERLRRALADAGADPEGVAAFGQLLASAADRITTDHFGAGGASRSEVPVWLVSAPGRSELGGNHTDHNLGKALACSINLDTAAVVAPRADAHARLWSQGFEPVAVDLSDTSARERERGTTAALLRGVAGGLAEAGYSVGGFDAVVSSRVLPGSGLSSSASVEVLIGTAFSALYNDGRVDPVTVARIGQRAENKYFGKPCGLMDQLASAVGGIIGIDFQSPDRPGIERLSYSFRDHGMALLIVDTGGSHADLTDDYAAVPQEMRAVAQAMRTEFMRGVSRETLLERLPELRPAVSDRAVLRALHFIDDTKRVNEMVDALRRDDIQSYLHLVAESGRSSAMLLQNTFSAHAPDEQGVSLALALTEQFFADNGLANGRGAACRVHGGGFAGTIQAYLPLDQVDGYERFMNRVFGAAAVTELAVRDHGAFAVAP